MMSETILLERIAEQLDAHPDEHAAWLRGVIALFEADPDAGWQRLNSKRMWGGAGSVANAAMDNNPGMDATQWEMHVRELRSLLIELAEQQKSRGEAYPDIDFWLSAFSTWNQT